MPMGLYTRKGVCVAVAPTPALTESENGTGRGEPMKGCEFPMAPEVSLLRNPPKPP